MKRKELAEYIDKMSDFLDSAEPVAMVNINGPKWYQELAEAAMPDKAELYAFHYGAIAALVEVYGMLTGEIEPTDPVEHAKKMIGRTIRVTIAHRIVETLRAGAAND